MKSGLLLLLVHAQLVLGATWYVSPTGSASNDGSIAYPWSLKYAATNTSVIGSGDTLYLRGGTYSDFDAGTYGQLEITITGTEVGRLTISSYPGEWAVILATNGTLNAGKHIVVPFFNYTDFKNLEVASTKTAAYEFYPAAIDSGQPNCHHCTFTGLVLHDVSFGIQPWGYSTNTVIADCLMYNCGAANTEHAVYTQNNSTNAVKTFSKNLIWGSGAINLHIYGGAFGNQWGFRVYTNVLALSGRVSAGAVDLLVGGNAATNLVIRGNYFYTMSNGGAEIDYAHTTDMYGQDGIFADNYLAAFTPNNVNLVGIGLSANRWSNLVVTNNTIISRSFVSAMVDPGHLFSENVWDYNTYISPFDAGIYFTTNQQNTTSFSVWKTLTGYDAHSTLTTNTTPDNKLVVIPFDYSANKAWLVGFNYATNDNLSFDVSGVVTPGTSYTVKDGFNWAAGTLRSGQYSGAPISLPATNLVAASALVGASATHPGPNFVVYLLESTANRYTHSHGSGTLGSSTR